MINDELLYQELLVKIGRDEGFRSKAYRCPSGRLTIGFGHTHNVHIGDVISLSTAYSFLREDIDQCLSQVDTIGLPFKFHERLALSAFVFNLGFSKLKRSTLLSLITAYYNSLTNNNPTLSDRLLPRIKQEWLKWCHYTSPDGVTHQSNGLLSRRQFEYKLFSSGKIY